MSRTEEATRKKHRLTSLPLALAPYIILFGAAVILLALAEDSLSATIPYWELMIPFAAFFSLLSGWGQAYVSNQSRLWYLIRQAIHWGALMGVLYLLQVFGVREALGDAKYLVFLLYVFGLGTLFAGLHSDLKLLFFGSFLIFCAYLLMVPTNNVVLATLGETFKIADATSKPMMMTLLVAGAAFIATFMILVSMRGAILSKRVSAARR